MNPTTTSTCRSCGGAVLQGDRFCGSCGTPVPSATAELGGVDSDAAYTPHLAAGQGWKAVAARLQDATLGEFEILTELGRGGMAAVYLARDLALSRRVAIKVMAPGLLLGPGMVERFRREAVTVANLQHAHIVAIHSVRLLDDLHFFVMQFVPGRSLEALLREQGALPLAVVRAWLYQMGSALGYAHRRGVIHRDIKPGNILLNADGEAIVTDFGIAKVAESPGQTQTGTVVGTPVYMSPEQCYAKDLTGASDQYSLGVLAFEMLAGRPPFSGSTFALMRAHTDEEPPRIGLIRDDVPASVEAALMRMLAKRPEDRFAHVGEALVALGAAPVAPDDPIHTQLQHYAGAAERLQLLGDVLTTPASPIPMTRPRVGLGTPRTVPVAPKMVVVIGPPPTDLEPGAAGVLGATVQDASGQPVPGAAVQWSSGANEIVSVDASTGALQALAPGAATVTAKAGEASDSVQVIIGEPVPALVAVTVRPSRLRVGDRGVVSAIVTNRFGAMVARPVEWETDAPHIATIDRSAFASSAAVTVAAVAPGTVDVIATCGGAVGRGSVRILAAVASHPRSIDPSAVLPSLAPAGTQPPSTVRHETPAAASAPPSAPVRQETPAAASESAPAAAVISREDLAAASPPPKAQERTAPAPPPAQPATGAAPRKGGAFWRFGVPAALAAAILGYVLLKPATPSPTGADNTTVQRPDTSATRADTSAGGLVTPPPKPETTAIAGGGTPPVAGSRPVEPAPARRVSVPARLEIQPPADETLIPGETVPLVAIVRDSAGAVMQSARIAWSSNNEAVATVDPATGLVRAVTAGTTQITARAGGVRSTRMISVVAPPPDPSVVTSIEMSDVAAMTVGETTRLTASARNASGSTAIGAVIAFSSSDRGVATVSSEGTLTARGPGSAVIRASAGGRVAERSVTVNAPIVVVRPESTRRAEPPPKTEAELRSEVEAVLGTYMRAIQTRDTSLIRRVYPTVSSSDINTWQATFTDATTPIQVTGNPEVLDTLRDVAGSQVRMRYRGRINFSTRRAPVQQPWNFVMTLRRDAATWRIISITGR